MKQWRINVNYAVIFAGGIGKRMNNKALPKQFIELNGKPILIYTLENFENHPGIDGIVLVCLEAYIQKTKRLLDKYHITKVLEIVPGGKTGQESIRNGLFCLEKSVNPESIVLIHDGVRPLIYEETISDAITCTIQYGNAITTSPAIETLITKDENGEIRDIIPRSKVEMARAPQCFILKDIVKAHYRAMDENKNDFIDSASLMNHYGNELHTIIGPSENIKITTPMDFYLFKAIKEAQTASYLYGGR